MREEAGGPRHAAETYREAALEWIAEAQQLHQTGQWGLAHYIAGLAAECMLRAYAVRRDPQFDSRHDVKRLVKQAGFDEAVPASSAVQVAAALDELALRWSNDHRFRASRMVEAWLRRRSLTVGVKGNALQYSSRRIVAAALIVVQTGDRQWKR